jgi:hypothetical protein
MKKRKDLSLTEKATRALTDAVARVVEDHRRRQKPLAIWQDGRAIWISAAEADALRETPITYRTKSHG